MAGCYWGALWGLSHLFRWHDDVIKWKHFPRYWPFVRGIHRSRWIPHTKANDAEFDVFFDLPPNKQLSKQWWGWWFGTQSCPLWRHSNENREDRVLVCITIWLRCILRRNRIQEASCRVKMNVIPNVICNMFFSVCRIYKFVQLSMCIHLSYL